MLTIGWAEWGAVTPWLAGFAVGKVWIAGHGWEGTRWARYGVEATLRAVVADWANTLWRVGERSTSITIEPKTIGEYNRT